MPSLSKSGAAFVGDHEGFVSKTYLCPAGVTTIGYGFTMRSKVFKAWWVAKHGRTLRKGDTISRADADMLLPKVFDEEYGAAVNAQIGTEVQHEYDGSGSVTFNCGPGCLKWTWAQLLKARDVPGAAKRLKVTAVTANGRRLGGLVRRRLAEAVLIEFGNYGVSYSAVPAAESSGAVEVEAYQKQLLKLGYDLGPAGADGLSGAATVKAVKKFQTDQDLVPDGKVGPATRAALIRAIDAKNGNKAVTAGPLATGGGAAAADGVNPDAVAANPDILINAAMWGLGALVVIGLAVFLLRYRGLLTGRRVPT